MKYYTLTQQEFDTALQAISDQRQAHVDVEADLAIKTAFRPSFQILTSTKKRQNFIVRVLGDLVAFETLLEVEGSTDFPEETGELPSLPEVVGE